MLECMACTSIVHTTTHLDHDCEHNMRLGFCAHPADSWAPAVLTLCTSTLRASATLPPALCRVRTAGGGVLAAGLPSTAGHRTGSSGVGGHVCWRHHLRQGAPVAHCGCPCVRAWLHTHECSDVHVHLFGTLPQFAPDWYM